MCNVPKRTITGFFSVRRSIACTMYIRWIFRGYSTDGNTGMAPGSFQRWKSLPLILLLQEIDNRKKFFCSKAPEPLGFMLVDGELDIRQLGQVLGTICDDLTSNVCCLKSIAMSANHRKGQTVASAYFVKWLMIFLSLELTPSVMHYLKSTTSKIFGGTWALYARQNRMYSSLAGRTGFELPSQLVLFLHERSFSDSLVWVSREFWPHHYQALKAWSSCCLKSSREQGRSSGKHSGALFVFSVISTS